MWITPSVCCGGSSIHFHSYLIRVDSEFESRMSHLLQAFTARNDDSGTRVMCGTISLPLKW
jgi:hypothetical protein